MKDKGSNFEWAVGMLRQAIESGTYGVLSFSMQNGVIGQVKTETTVKPPVDNKTAKT